MDHWRRWSSSSWTVKDDRGYLKESFVTWKEWKGYFGVGKGSKKPVWVHDGSRPTGLNVKDVKGFIWERISNWKYIIKFNCYNSFFCLTCEYLSIVYSDESSYLGSRKVSMTVVLTFRIKQPTYYKIIPLSLLLSIPH